MKDINSLLVMSGSEEADPQKPDEMTVDTDLMPSAGPLHSPREQITDLGSSSTMNIMDWTEYLIQLALTSDDHAIEEQILNSSPAISNLQRCQSTTVETEDDSMKTFTSSTSLGDSNFYVTQHRQEMSSEDGSTLTDTNNTSVLQEYVPASSSFDLHPSSPKHIHGEDSDTCDSTDLISLFTNENMTRQSSSIPPSQGLDCPTFSSHDHSPEVQESTAFISHSSESEAFSQSKFKQSSLTCYYGNHQTLDSHVSVPNVDLNTYRSCHFDINDFQPPVTSTSLPTFNDSLSTPVSETIPNLRNSNVLDVICSSTTNYSDHYQSVQFTDNSHTRNITSFHSNSSSDLTIPSYNAFINEGDPCMPDFDITTVEIVSSDTNLSSILQSSLNTNSNETFTSDNLFRPVTMCQKSETPCHWTDNNLFGVTVLPASTSEECTTHPCQPSLEQPCVDTSLPETLSTGMIVASYVDDDLPSSSVISIPERYSVQDLESDLLAMDTWNSSFISPGNCGNKQETCVSNINVSSAVSLSTSENFTLDNIKEIHDYCIGTSSLTYDNAEILPNTTRDTFPYGHDLFQEIIPQRFLNPEQTTNKYNKKEIKRSHTLGSTDLLMPGCSKPPDHSELQSFIDTSYQLTSPKSSLLSTKLQFKSSYLSQTSKYIPYHKPNPSELSSDALLSPGDVYKSIGVSDSATSAEGFQRNTTNTRTISDKTDTSVGGSDFSNTQSTASVSGTDEEYMQDPIKGDKLKDTLRSKMKAKRTSTGFSDNVGYFVADENQKSPKRSLDMLSSCGEFPSTSRASLLSSKVKSSCSTTSGSYSKHGSSSRQSSISNISQEVSIDDEEVNVDDEDEGAVSEPPAKKKKREKKESGKQDDNDSETTQLAKKEKNRMAAQKCRRKKRDKIDILTQQILKLEHKQERIKTEVDKLEIEREQLQEILRLHSFVCQHKDKFKDKKDK